MKKSEGRGYFDPNFQDAKTVKYFLDLCSKAERTSISWKKFRLLDKKGLFADYSTSHLNVQYNTKTRAAKGVCVRCGTKKPEGETLLCKPCKEKKK